MGVPVRTGRARPSHGCRWCGGKAETVLYEVRDPETGGIGSEVLCCVCGKEQWRWGAHRKFWARETHREIVRSLLVGSWLAAQIIQCAQRIPAGSPAAPVQLELFGAVL